MKQKIRLRCISDVSTSNDEIEMAEIPLKTEANEFPQSCLNEMDVDDFLTNIGEFGKSQKLTLFFLSLLMIPASYQSLLITFIGINPSWICTNKTIECNLTGVISVNHRLYNKRCSMKRESWRYEKEIDFSIISEWDLICDKLTHTYMVNSGAHIGGGIGTIFVGFLSDRYGRKRTLFPTFVVLIALSFASAFVRDFWTFFVLRILTGFLQGGLYLSLWILMTELLGPSSRSYSNLVWCSYTIAMCLMALQSWLVWQWRILVIILTAPYLIFLPTYSFVTESVRWLRVKGDIVTAEKILRQIAKCNQKPWPNARLKPITDQQKEVKASYKDIFYPFNVFLSTFVQAAIWFSNGSAYYGISLASEHLSDNIYRDFFLISIVDIPSNIIIIWLCNRFGRKWTTVLSTIVGGLFVVMLSFIPSHSGYVGFRVTVAVIAKFCVNLSYGAVYIWSTELFPTSIRSQGLGVCAWAAILGAAAAPWFSQYLGYVHRSLPFCVMGSILIISGIFCCVLKETNGKSTAETLSDRNRNIVIDDTMTDAELDYELIARNVENKKIIL
ncbi:solute carrier family 22 member 15-like isoform X2 [Hydra vulgaris]|uniref:Solute carrier family 22 member 15-like isoform X2 n=1 Tax=Hydra vulgaris TaxID=6087 RepID=A0ABM4BQJ9_HYDVU